MEEAGGGASRTTEPAAGSSSGTDVSLREHFGALRQADQTLWRTMFGMITVLGFVIWRELQRRDETLNHEAARLQASVAANVSADTYQANEQQRTAERAKDETWRKKVDDGLAQTVGREEFKAEAKSDRRQIDGARVAGLSVLIAVIGVVISLFAYQLLRHAHPSSPAATTTIVQTATVVQTSPAP